MSAYYLAIDIGASSGRHILGHMENGRIVLEEIYRFKNRQIRRNGHDCWDLEALFAGVLEGLAQCGRLGKHPETIAIDTWGVDFVLLGDHDERLGDPVAYRDGRTKGMDAFAEKRITAGELYERTGIQKQLFNTIYQLLALKKEAPEQLEQAKSLLMIPDYLNFLLTGRKCQEYTNATTTGLVNARSRSWDMDLIRRLGLPEGLFGPLSMPGAEAGPLLPSIAETAGFSSRVILPATHDTGSAYLSVPAKDRESVFLSSGTWSLLGCELESPITSEDARRLNFTNEGGAGGSCRFLKNIMGLWIIQSIRRELSGEAYVTGKDKEREEKEPAKAAGGGKTDDVKSAGAGKKERFEAAGPGETDDVKSAGAAEMWILPSAFRPSGHDWTFPELIENAARAEGFPSLIDVNEDRFLAPESMIRAICEACRESHQIVPANVGELMQCVYQSLAQSYAAAIRELSSLTGVSYTGICIVGGGCQDDYLNKCTARAAGLPVFAGPVEGTAIGNLLVQMLRAGEFPSLDRAREAVRKSFDIKTFPGRS